MPFPAKSAAQHLQFQFDQIPGGTRQIRYCIAAILSSRVHLRDRPTESLNWGLAKTCKLASHLK
jgi:hypothetical protein